MQNNTLAIIGSGPTALYLLKHIADHNTVLKKQIKSITIFEKKKTMGMGMPYSFETTDKYNLANISSEEIPELPQTFADWLRLQDKEKLKKWNITQFPISETEVYSRLALGHYFHQQYQLIITKLKLQGFTIVELPNHKVADISVDKYNDSITVKTENNVFTFTKIVISVGHNWTGKDDPELGYYGSPWPINKIIPKKNTYYNFEVGVLGASLSAFDVVTSLAHRHGDFVKSEKGLSYSLNKKAKGFKIILHSSQGWLPHLQYEQEEPIREIYRHATREEILSLVGKNGFLSIEDFYAKVCRPALIKAFYKDKNEKLVHLIKKTDFGFKNFIETMSSRHEYIDSFIGMKNEMILAQDSIKNNKPIHWMETMDDLMYCLNFHNELLSAEDYLWFKKEVMPFLMNVIAALPLSSASILLALYDADCIDLVRGKVTLLKPTKKDKRIHIEIENEKSQKSTSTFNMFIHCGGQKNIEIENYPFPSLVKQGIVSKAKAEFESNDSLNNSDYLENITYSHGAAFLYTGGINVDATYKVIGQNGERDNEIYDVTFTHITGARPYSYGLQACNATSLIVVESWLLFDTSSVALEPNIENITKLYKENENL